jgi:hypothetical protein
MGRELETRVIFAGVERPRARVHLDSKALQVSGRPRIEVAFAEVARVEVDAGRLRLSTPRGLLVIEAGEEAETWAQKIRTPPTRAKKLGLRSGARAAISGVDDASLPAELEAAGATLGPLQAPLDLVFLGVDSAASLARLPSLVTQLASDGALWIVRRKGRGASVSEDAVRSAARSAGLVDVKVVAFSDTHSADKFVIPVAARAATPARSGTAEKKAKPAKKRRA